MKPVLFLFSATLLLAACQKKSADTVAPATKQTTTSTIITDSQKVVAVDSTSIYPYTVTYAGTFTDTNFANNGYYGTYNELELISAAQYNNYIIKAVYTKAGQVVFTSPNYFNLPLPTLISDTFATNAQNYYVAAPNPSRNERQNFYQMGVDTFRLLGDGQLSFKCGYRSEICANEADYFCSFSGQQTH